MSGQNVVGAFNEISEVYDQTRDPLAPAVLEKLRATLAEWGIERILEVGVGTGRVSAPLTHLGLRMTGVDASPGMLAKARAKGLERLVRGSAYALPFPDGGFDAALFVHVLHLLDRPAAALAEACRVGRHGAVALVRPRPRRDPTADAAVRPRRRVIELLRAEGIEVPASAGGGPPVRERQLLEQMPPERLTLLHEEDVTETVAEELKLLERRASRWTLNVPAEPLARAVAQVRREVGDRTHTYHQVLSLALWTKPPAALPA